MILLWTSVPLWGLDPKSHLVRDYQTPVAPPPPDPVYLLLKLLLFLLVMLVVTGVLIWWVRRSRARTLAAVPEPHRLQYRDVLALDTRNSIHLLEADGQTVMVTTNQQGIQSMVVLQDDFQSLLEK